MEGSLGSDRKNTNDFLMSLWEFLFVHNSWLTWIHIGILLLAVILGVWLWHKHKKAERRKFSASCGLPQAPCSLMARDWFDGVRESNSRFIYAFGISAVTFAIGVWFESKGSGGLPVQVATYLPALVLAWSQLWGIRRSGIRLCRHLGV